MSTATTATQPDKSQADLIREARRAKRLEEKSKLEKVISEHAGPNRHQRRAYKSLSTRVKPNLGETTEHKKNRIRSEYLRVQAAKAARAEKKAAAGPKPKTRAQERAEAAHARKIAAGKAKRARYAVKHDLARGL
jgi:hypothetical protein